MKHIQVYQVVVYMLGIPKGITKIRGNNVTVTRMQKKCTYMKVIYLCINWYKMVQMVKKGSIRSVHKVELVV